MTSAAPTTTAATSAPAIPAVSPQAQAVGFIDVRTVVPDAVLDLRYATANNFTGTQLYPSDARCLVHQSMASGLKTAADELRRQGYLLVLWDCYRPHDVQVRMYQVVSNPDWVAKPGPYSRSHESGRSVDVSLMSGSSRQPVDMGTTFDDFTDRAHAYATSGVTAAQQHNRAVLRTAMSAGGLSVYTGEWWHFDGAGASVQRPIINVPVD